MKARTTFLIGQRFNRLVILSLHRQDRKHRKYFLCRCDCGAEKVILGSQMSSENTRSCGCLNMEVRKSTRLPNNHGEITAIILGYKRHANRRNFNFSLTREQVIEIIKMNCHYCGSDPVNHKVTKNSINGLKYNGIDRTDSTKDYTIDNVVPCCGFCNKAKNNKPVCEFLEWAIKVANRAMAAAWSPDLTKS